MRKRNPQLNAAVTPEIDAVVTDRAEALGITKSKFTSLILAKWHAEGCPPVNEPDSLLERSRSRRKAP